MFVKKHRIVYIQNIVFPCVVFSAITGISSALIIFLFKICAGKLSSISSEIYSFVRTNPKWLPLLILVFSVLGLLAGVLLRRNKDCRGGGIPTAIAALRGYAPFTKLQSIITVFVSSMATYLCGVPLGTEGPSVQIGALTGFMMSKLTGKKHGAWERYIMTGGACSGFAAATGAPLSGIFFAFEEAHTRFSPMIFMIASMTVLFGTVTGEFISACTGVSTKLFSLEDLPALPLKSIWIALCVGLICGICAILFTKAYAFIRRTTEKKLEALPFTLEIALIFGAVSLIGFFSKDSVGTGHHLIEKLIEGHGIWYSLIICFIARALALMIANTQGVTGGLFIPILAFGSIIGALCGKVALSLGLLSVELYPVIVIIGMVSFLSAASRIPITALLFSIEALSGISIVLPIAIGVTVAFVVIELGGISSFTDTVIEKKLEEYNDGKKKLIFDVKLTVKEGAFVIGKEIRDILWPSSCTVVSKTSAASTSRIGSGMAEGDVLHIHYKTAHAEETAEELERLLGKQDTQFWQNPVPND